jgi:hypothetical protein
VRWLEPTPEVSTEPGAVHLEADVTAWIKAWNANPKPFVWIKSADEILDNLTAYCTRLNQLPNDSGH